MKPLSDRNTISVLSSCPFRRSASTIWATPSSTAISASFSWRQFSWTPAASSGDSRGRSATTCGLSYMSRSLKLGGRGIRTPANASRWRGAGEGVWGRRGSSGSRGEPRCGAVYQSDR